MDEDEDKGTENGAEDKGKPPATPKPPEDKGKPPATPKPPEPDPRDKELAELREFKRKADEANMSEKEKQDQRQADLDAREAKLKRREAFVAKGLPGDLADEEDPTKIAERIQAMVASGVKGKETGQDLAPAMGATPPPAADPKAKAQEDADPRSEARWAKGWAKRMGQESK